MIRIAVDSRPGVEQQPHRLQVPALDREDQHLVEQGRRHVRLSGYARPALEQQRGNLLLAPQLGDLQRCQSALVGRINRHAGIEQCRNGAWWPPPPDRLVQVTGALTPGQRGVVAPS